MPDFTRTVSSFGDVEHVTVSDDLAPWYRDHGYEEVVTVGAVAVPVDEAADARAALEERAELEQQVAELKGAALDDAVKAAKIAHPSALTADEKRAALVDKTTADESGEAGNPTKEN